MDAAVRCVSRRRRRWEAAFAAVGFLFLHASDPVQAAGPVRLEALAPGLEIAKTAPQGWTDLVLKSIPKITSGDTDTLPGPALASASLFRTVILADVRPDGTGGRSFRLERVGIGLATPVGRSDRVVSADAARDPNNPLGLIDRQVLAAAEVELAKGRVVASTPTFALFLAPSVRKVGASHRQVQVGYAFLVEPGSGRLHTVCWSGLGGETRRLTDAPTLLAPGQVSECGLDVLAEKWLGTIPHRWSFAMRSLPAGQALVVPAGLTERLLWPSPGSDDPAGLERSLRAVLPVAARPVSADQD